MSHRKKSFVHMVTPLEELWLLLFSLTDFHHSFFYLLPLQSGFRIPLEGNVWFAKFLPEYIQGIAQINKKGWSHCVRYSIHVVISVTLLCSEEHKLMIVLFHFLNLKCSFMALRGRISVEILPPNEYGDSPHNICFSQ